MLPLLQMFGIVWGDKAETPVFSIFPAALLRTGGLTRFSVFDFRQIPVAVISLNYWSLHDRLKRPLH